MLDFRAGSVHIYRRMTEIAKREKQLDMEELQREIKEYYYL
jgi:hypothetical protein